MTDADRPAFAMELGTLAEVFGESLSAVRAEAYFMALAAYSLADIRAAIRDVIGGNAFFPKPAEIIAAMPKPQTRAYRMLPERALSSAEAAEQCPEPGCDQTVGQHIARCRQLFDHMTERGTTRGQA